MPDFSRQANVSWQGGLTDGSGQLSLATGVLQNVAVTWQARTEGGVPTTSPEELIAGAHASCYAMAFSNVLAQAGHPPERLDITAEVGASLGQAGLKVTTSKLSVRGRVPGIDQARFEELARQGEASCPVSNALRGNLEITVDATLEG
jgi:osmotically inducible protein OsmC